MHKQGDLTDTETQNFYINHLNKNKCNFITIDAGANFLE